MPPLLPISNCGAKSPRASSALYEQLSFIYRLKLYALFINGEIMLPFIDSDLLYRCPLRQDLLNILGDIFSE